MITLIKEGPDSQLPQPGKKIYSCNEGNYARWSQGQKDLVGYFRGDDGNGGGFSHRYVGSLVADFHRTLLYGGMFMYPPDSKSPNGKLRLLYEAAPLAMICEQAGGRATDGFRDISSIEPDELHQRTPLYMGNTEWVDLAGEHLARDG